MSSCFCIGPQNGEPLCPCKMQEADPFNALVWRSRAPNLEPDIDLSAAPMVPNNRTLQDLHSEACRIRDWHSQEMLRASEEVLRLERQMGAPGPHDRPAR